MSWFFNVVIFIVLFRISNVMMFGFVLPKYFSDSQIVVSLYEKQKNVSVSLTLCQRNGFGKVYNEIPHENSSDDGLYICKNQVSYTLKVKVPVKFIRTDQIDIRDELVEDDKINVRCCTNGDAYRPLFKWSRSNKTNNDYIDGRIKFNSTNFLNTQQIYDSIKTNEICNLLVVPATQFSILFTYTCDVMNDENDNALSNDVKIEHTSCKRSL